MEHPAVAQGARGHMIERATPALGLVQAVNQDILRDVEFRKRAPELRLFGAAVPIRPERLRLEDH